MPHDHAHSHHHAQELKSASTALVAGIALNFLFVIIEVSIGLSVHSLSLISDAGHNLADVASLALSLLAFRLLRVRSNSRYTYGYRKTSIIVALFNAIVLLVSVGAISYEAVQKLFHPAPLPGKTIAIVAAIGIVINGATGLLFFRDKEKDINLKSAYLHLMGDALVSLALVVGGIIMIYTQWFWIDPVLSILVAVVILLGTWKLLKDSLRLSLDGIPAGISLEKVTHAAMKIPGVQKIYHIHVWAISTAENALTAHLVLAPHITLEKEKQIKARLKHELEHQGIRHATLETEREELHADCSEQPIP
jgi:cobalt-zinc-cadmium efflux system protein